VSPTHTIDPNAAGIDIGATEIYIAVPADRDPHPVRRFATFTEDLIAAADWLKRCGIKTVAMESTGVYWIPLFQILEARGLKVCLVNARHVKNVPGRKCDVCDCQWLQHLHSAGLLRASFRPEQQVCAVRSLVRYRDSLIGAAINLIRSQAEETPDMAGSNISPDPGDEPFCICAETGNANFIVTLNPRDFPLTS
jgi:transposase